MDIDWTRVWEAAEQARLVLGWTKQDLYERAKISETTYLAMCHGKALTRADKRHQFAAAFGWAPSDLDHIAAGGEAPIPIPPRGAPDLPERLDNIESEVRLLAEMVATLKDQLARFRDEVRRDRHW